jgi:hypothetical protein
MSKAWRRSVDCFAGVPVVAGQVFDGGQGLEHDDIAAFQACAAVAGGLSAD